MSPFDKLRAGLNEEPEGGKVNLKSRMLNVEVGRIKIRSRGGPLSMDDLVDIDGDNPEWPSKITIVLEVGKAARMTLQGPALKRKRENREIRT